MTPEVKQRIEQIQQGIVPKGYKKTKSDIVPVDWKESSIGEYICEYTEKTTIPNQYPVLTSARTGLMLQTDYYSNRQVTTEDNVGYNVLPYGYITFRSRSDDGRFRFNENRIIERGVISYFYPVFSFSEEVCHEYMLYLLNFSIYRRMYPYAEGTAQQVLSLKKLGQLKYSLPLVAEQKKIAEILATQDKAIELQERKIDELKRFKKGCLEKMFPRKGQKVPEKRFPGFTDDWEQRKLGEMGQTYTGLSGKTKDDFGHGQARFVTYMNVFSNPISNPEMTEPIEIDPKQNEVEVGDVFFTTSSETPEEVGMSSILLEKRGKIYLNSFCFGFRPSEKIDSYYLAYMLRSESTRAKIILLAQGISRYNISKNKVMEIAVSLPSLDEQKMIGQYFSQLDNLITLHQRKLEEMKKQKKALMQLLLTGIVKTKGEVR